MARPWAAPERMDGMNAQERLQERIDAQQALDAIVYAQRALKTDPNLAHSWASGQWARGRAAAAELGVTVEHHPCYGARAASCQIAAAKNKASDRLKGAKAALKDDVGGVRQLRLALGELRECFTEGCGAVIDGRFAAYCDACVERQLAEQGDELAAFDAFHAFADAVAA